MLLVRRTADRVGGEHDAEPQVDRIEDGREHAHVRLGAAYDQGVGAALAQHARQRGGMERRVEAFVEHPRRRHQTTERLHQVEKPQIHAARGELPPVLEIAPPGAGQFLRLGRRDEAREDRVFRMPFGDGGHDRQDAVHPGRVPGRLRREDVLHIDAEMECPLAERPPAECVGTHRCTGWRIVGPALSPAPRRK